MTTLSGEMTSETTTSVTAGGHCTAPAAAVMTTTTALTATEHATLAGAAALTTTTATTTAGHGTLSGAASMTTSTALTAAGTDTPYDEEADEMARGAIPYSSLVANSSLTDPAGTTIVPADDHYIAAAEPERTILRVANTAGSEYSVTIKAGDNPPAFGAGLGDLVVAVPATTGVKFIGPFESGRFLQNDGTMNIDCPTSMTGTITAFLIPRSV